MKGLIKKILKEESEIKEMGINFNKVKVSQPKNYLVKSLIDKEKNKDLKDDLKKITQKCNILYSQIVEELKNVKWEDIILIEHNKFFYVSLPKKIKDNIKKLSDLYHLLEYNNYLNGLNPRDRITAMISDYDLYLTTDYIAAYIDEPRNRTHFPKGLPTSLLGFNLGFKIYRKLLNTIGFIQSEENATQEVHEVYRRLLQLPDVNAVIYKDSVLLIEDGLPKNKVIDIVSASIYDRYKNNPNSKKLVLNRSIIVNSKLLKIIGETNLLNMMYELFYPAKKDKDYEKSSFEGLGYITGV